MTDFSDWYALYPRKVGKHKAEAVWNRLTLPERQQAMDALPAHVHRWRMTATGWDFLPHPSTWLFQKRWQDELPNNGGARSGNALDTAANSHGTSVVRSPPPLNGAPAASPQAIASNPTPLGLVAAGAPPVVRSATGPVELGAILAGLKLQLKRSKA